MHISEGILSAPVLITGAIMAAGGVSVGIRKLDHDKIPQVAVLTAAFFIASLVHVPIGPVSAHLVLNGLMGLILGWIVFPAILIGLLLQAVLFQFGGLTTLGVNTTIMAFPAIICFFLFRPALKSEKSVVLFTCAFLCGFVAALTGITLAALALVFTGKSFLTVSKIIVLSHLPVMLAEGLITALCIQFLKKVKPEMLGMVYNCEKAKGSED
jgi:cobalt/nickel transport system permease protein